MSIFSNPFGGGGGSGTGDVAGPATNTDNNVPQWDGADSKTLKDGLAVGTAANNLLQLDGDAKIPAVDGSNLTNLSGVTSADFTSISKVTEMPETPDENILYIVVSP